MVEDKDRIESQDTTNEDATAGTETAKTDEPAEPRQDDTTAETASAESGTETQETATETAVQDPEAIESAVATPDELPDEALEAAEKVTTAIEVSDDELEELGYTREEYEAMAEMYESTLRSIDEGELVKGRVLSVNENEVMVDIGFKSEGRIPIEEFTEPDEIKPGDEISVLLEATEDQDGEVRVSKRKADFLQVWDKIKEAHDDQSIVEGVPKRRIKGGLKVDLFGVEAFLPGSQVALRRIPNLEDMLGKRLRFRILKVNKRRRNIVISRRVVLEDERQSMKEELLKELEVGQTRQGVVKNITDFGAFVDLGGIDGLLHITDMSWGRIRHPSELVAIGDELTVKVLSFDPERERISLGLKQLMEYPWENVEDEFPVNSKVRGKVVSITDYGAFIELKEGVEGLVHISEMSWTQHIRHPSKILGIGDIVEVKVLNVNKPEEKISLSLKRTESDPWQDLDTKYPVGTRIEGRVRNLTDFGAFVQLEEGMDGLVHISDMSWTKRIKHPSEVVHRGEKVEVMVLGIDKDRHRISLGIKQCQENPWPEIAEKYAVGTHVDGKVSRIHKSGIVVEIPEDIEGFVPMSHLALPDISRVEARFAPGDTIPLEVIEVSPENRRIVLSVKTYMEKQPEETLQEYIAAHEVRSELLEPSEGEEKADDSGKKPEEKSEGDSEEKPEDEKPEGDSEEKPEDEKPEGEAEEKPEEKPEGDSEEKPEEKPEGDSEEKPEEKSEGDSEEKPEEKSEGEADEKPEEKSEGEAEKKPEEKPEGDSEEKPEDEKPEDDSEEKPEEEKPEGDSEEKPEEEKKTL
ncbi:MAG: 30S ribosomal protein S1 [Candidatus Eisenbacteria bacterium]|nr:30S ribosomal protein S1 [Candidatus Eisenbacteria bacterium]